MPHYSHPEIGLLTEELELALFSPLTVDDDFWEGGREDVDAILAQTALEAGASVLMIPRGAGQHALAFAERGLSVCAVGPPDESLELSRARARELGVEVEFVEVDDASTFSTDQHFDLVLNLSSSFDFVQGSEGDVLRTVYGALNDRGWLILRMVSLDSSGRRVSSRDWNETESGLLVLEELEHDWAIGWVSYRWLIVAADGRRYEFHLGHRGYDAEWVEQAVKDAGFSEVRTCGSLDGEPFASDTPLVIFARK